MNWTLEGLLEEDQWAGEVKVVLQAGILGQGRGWTLGGLMEEEQ